MNAARIMALCALSFAAQGALANTIWLKDRQGEVCYNTASTNPGQVVGYGGVNRDGSGFTLTISNPANGVRTPSTGDCADLPTTPSTNPIVFNGALVAQLFSTHMWKQGTQQAMECLDQGVSMAGVSGPVSNAQYALDFTTTFQDGCDMPTQTPITPNGLPFIERKVTMTNPNVPSTVAPIFEGYYHIFNAASVPEPDSALLLLAGALGLGGVALARRRAKGKSGL